MTHKFFPPQGIHSSSSFLLIPLPIIRCEIKPGSWWRYARTDAMTVGLCLNPLPLYFQTNIHARHRRRMRDTGMSSSEVTQFAQTATAAVSTAVPTHRVTVHDRQRGVVHEFWVPEDQYILHTAESQDIRLPFACRHGCCTSCAVRVKSGQVRQPEALGISAELKSKGYALLCVGFPSSDVEVETQDEDEVYWLQFGRYFARGPIERDDYALELAMGDE